MKTCIYALTLSGYFPSSFWYTVCVRKAFRGATRQVVCSQCFYHFVNLFIQSTTLQHCLFTSTILSKNRLHIPSISSHKARIPTIATVHTASLTAHHKTASILHSISSSKHASHQSHSSSRCLPQSSILAAWCSQAAMPLHMVSTQPVSNLGGPTDLFSLQPKSSTSSRQMAEDTPQPSTTPPPHTSSSPKTPTTATLPKSEQPKARPTSRSCSTDGSRNPPETESSSTRHPSFYSRRQPRPMRRGCCSHRARVAPKGRRRRRGNWTPSKGRRRRRGSWTPSTWGIRWKFRSTAQEHSPMVSLEASFSLCLLSMCTSLCRLRGKPDGR